MHWMIVIDLLENNVLHEMHVHEMHRLLAAVTWHVVRLVNV